jgi:hypothetical protein
MKTTKPRTRLCLLLVMLAGCGLVPLAQPRWYQLVSPNNDFSVSFPGQPQHKTSTSSPKLELYTFSFGQHALSVGYQDIVPPPLTPAQRAEALAAAVSDQLQWISANGRLLRHAPLPDGGHQFDFTSQLEAGVPLYSRDRIYVAGARYYHLTCLSLSPQGLDAALAN